MKYHKSITKKCANSVILFEPYSNMVFSKEAKIWNVPVVKVFKRVFDQFSILFKMKEPIKNDQPWLMGISTESRTTSHIHFV